MRSDRKTTCTALLGAGLSAAVGAWCGMETPGLLSIVVYLAVGLTAYQAWARQSRKPFWALLLFIGAALPLLVGMPLRLCAVALRGIEGGVRFNLDALALGLTAAWFCLGTVYVCHLFFMAEPEQQRPTGE